MYHVVIFPTCFPLCLTKPLAAPTAICCTDRFDTSLNLCYSFLLGLAHAHGGASLTVRGAGADLSKGAKAEKVPGLTIIVWGSGPSC